MREPAVVRGDAMGEGQQTAGMTRREAFAGDGVWVGTAETEPSAVSAWHHHGDHETYIYCVRGAIRVESGADGGHVVEARAGDFMHIPRATIHRESNPTTQTQLLVVSRFGTGPVVVNVDGPNG